MNAGMIVSKQALEKMGQEKFAFNPVGTGPYELSVWEPKKRIQLKAFKDFWGEKPKVDTVTFIPIAEETTCEIALRTGEIDVSRVAPLNIAAFKKDPKFSVSLKPDLRIYWLGLTVNKPPFDNLKAREALRYALDVDKIIEAAYFGLAERATTILPPGVPGRWEDAPVYKQDLQKAKLLLKEAGMPDGFKMTLNGPSFDAQRVMAEVIKADAAKVGIDVEIQLKEQAAANDVANKGEASAYFTNYTSTVDPAYVMQWFVPGTGWNPSQWDNKAYVELLEKGGKEIDPKKRSIYYVDAQKEMDKDAWAIWLTHGFKVWISPKKVDMGAIFPNGMLAPWTMELN
jgi:peptide/nickel transport system substrate-binding protein